MNLDRIQGLAKFVKKLRDNERISQHTYGIEVCINTSDSHLTDKEIKEIYQKIANACNPIIADLIIEYEGKLKNTALE